MYVYTQEENLWVPLHPRLEEGSFVTTYVHYTLQHLYACIHPCVYIYRHKKKNHWVEPCSLAPTAGGGTFRWNTRPRFLGGLRGRADAALFYVRMSAMEAAEAVYI
jgi:hypothetical protein